MKSVRSGETDILLDGLDMVNDTAASLDVVLCSNGGKAAGTVQNPKTRQPTPGATANPTL